MLKTLTMKATLIAFIGSISFPAHAIADTQRIDVPAGGLVAALETLAKQADVDIVYQEEQLKGLQTAGVSGNLSPRDAVMKLLEGTPLQLRTDEVSGALLITPLPSGGAEPSTPANAASSETSPQRSSQSSKSFRDRFRLAQAETNSPQSSSSSGVFSETAESTQERRIALEEIVVTGTHIRGGNSSSAPVLTFDRVTLERSGYPTIEQFVQSLPQNLSTFSDGTFGQVNGGADGSYGQGSGINLRGLGGDSTLVLLNGRRLAPAAQGHYVDISLIPLSVVERIEVLTDGASAIYGSDAVGGVVNILLRKEMDGAESRLRYGTGTDGESSDLQLGQSIGRSWASGGVLVSYDYFRRAALDAADRDFIDLSEAGLLVDLKLLPRQERHGLLVTGSQNLGDRLEITGDLLFGRRDSDLAYQIIGLPAIPIDSEARQSSGSLGAVITLGADWQLRMSGSHGENETRDESVSPVLNSLNEFRTRLWSADVAADGAVAQLPGGAVRLALGGQYREEELRDDAQGSVDNPLVNIDRDVIAAYGELLVPLVGDGNRSPGVERLELTLAARFEDYSDFGSTTNPKAGVSWSPLGGLNVRATYGKSFKAPLLSELNPASFRPFAYLLIDPASPSGFTPALILQGSALDLGPEEATTWTAGVDFTPAALPGFTVKATYFDIDFEDRIAPPLPFDERLFSILLDPTVQVFIDRNPDLAVVDDLLSRPNFANVTGGPLSAADIGAIADSRLINIAGSVLRGVDLSLAYATATRLGDVSFQLLGDYLFTDEDQVLPATPATENLNTVYHQPDLRIRSSASWSRGGLTATAFVNYIDNYRDDRSAAETGPNQRPTVASWTTVDASLIWASGNRPGSFLQGTTISLSALNVLDRDPPFIASPLGLYFDGVNATPLGRRVSVNVTKQW